MTPPLAPTLPPWPEKRIFFDTDREELRYQRALATAWEARCRLAIGLLEDLKGSSMSERWTREQATEALAAIGQLPPTNQKDQS